MDVYLNEWSLRDSKDIVENWTAIKNFNALFGKLAKAGNLCFYAPENLWDIPISGFNVKTGVRLDGRGVPKEHSMLLRTIYGKFSIIKDGLPYFSKSEEMVMPSATMGLAAENSAPVISFAFDEEYRVDFFSGWVKHLDNSVERARVNNVFEEKPSNYELIVDLSLCRKLNPLDEPMWNSGPVENLLRDVDFVGQDPKSRQGLLYKYGRKVAEMNGWRYNEKLSKLNGNNGQLRYIFDSSLSFPDYPTAYLSLDMEGPDLAFELCDRRGRHQGECSWNGARKEAKRMHDIRIR